MNHRLSSEDLKREVHAESTRAAEALLLQAEPQSRAAQPKSRAAE